MTTPPQVLLVPGNPLDLTEEKLRGLAEDIGTDFTTGFSREPQGPYGVTWWEVLAIYIATKGADALIGHATIQTAERTVGKVRRWVKQRRSETETKRPFFLVVRDEEGNVLRALEFSVEGEQDVTEQEQEKPNKPRPPAPGT